MRYLIVLTMIFVMMPIQADDSAIGVIKGTGGVLLGAPIGFFTGLTRGAISNAKTFQVDIQEAFGNETTASKVISYPLGFVSGGVFGAIAGAIKGVRNGIYYGVKEPFSQESFSVDGPLDQFDVLDYSKAQYGLYQ